MSEKQQPQDIENQTEFEFIFDIALAPEFNFELSSADKLPYYDIEVSEEQIDTQVKNFAQQAGHPESVEEYADRDILRGALAQQDEKGNVLEGGLALDKASLMPAYFVNDDQKKIFEGAKVGDVITFNPSAAHSENELGCSPQGEQGRGCTIQRQLHFPSGRNQPFRACCSRPRTLRSRV